LCAPLNSHIKGLKVNKVVIAILATFVVAGCATVKPERIDAIESRLSSLENQVATATSTANRASQEASAAQTAAQRALDAANQANERVQRIAETCCARK
jgi:outer membrane murein-binding lipoprotein Lpp